MSNIERLISEQVLTWTKHQEIARKKRTKPVVWPVITISREYGAGGRTLAKELGNRTDFKIWDKNLLGAIADEAGADQRFLASLDEKRRKMVDDFFYGSLMGSKHSNTHYFRSLLRVVHTIAAHGSSIIVGRGSNYIIKSSNALHIRLVRPFKERVAYLAKLRDQSLKDAEKLVKEYDAERDDFIKYYFKHDGSQVDFDLVINSGVFTMEQIAELVLSAYEKKLGKSIPQKV